MVQWLLTMSIRVHIKIWYPSVKRETFVEHLFPVERNYFNYNISTIIDFQHKNEEGSLSLVGNKKEK